MSVIVAKDGPVTIVTIDRSAKRNAVAPLTALALREAFAAFAQDGAARVAILTARSGPFCAGFDLGAVGARRSAPGGAAPTGPPPLPPEHTGNASRRDRLCNYV